MANESPGRKPACKPDQHEVEVIHAGLRDALQDISFDDYTDTDSSAVVCSTLTDKDIIAQMTVGEKPVGDLDENDEDEEVPTRIVTRGD